ncbi:AAC(3) family N-acetyltransferase [Kineosporia mesophila]|uniref:Aminoglycoside N(3)-acetyltransferase n=1 Tax=Kineosporia mesophila TaxID=566012 RepID=A0ABP6ZH58_9ACTN|nr:AAC(3) family N-acetyltransferase [Kineosporia mesophila]MCD5350113.1 AAC(3) family N-acetyltransferase [Kineosporia mesophila]
MIHPAATPATPGPFGVFDLVAHLREIGVLEGDRLVLHVSLRSLGWVSGGPVALLQALLQAVGEEGTLIVPTFTTYLNDPQTWLARPVPEDWIPSVRDTLPGFDPDLHAAQPGLGRFPELLRTHPRARRSRHPVYSMAAVGAGAAELMDDAPLDWALGEHGPLGRTARAGAKILAIGLPWWSRCTWFHLSEHRAPYPGRLMYEIPMCTQEGWVTTRQIVFHDGDFEALGRAGESAVLSQGYIGAASSTLVDGSRFSASIEQWLPVGRDLTGFRPPPPFGQARPAPARVL